MKLMVPLLVATSATAATIAATGAFHVHCAGQEQIPAHLGFEGARVQPWPGGTTSRCPAKAKCRLPSGPGRTAKQFSTASPARRKEAMHREAQRREHYLQLIEHRSTRGVTLGAAIRRLARSSTSVILPRLAGFS